MEQGIEFGRSLYTRRGRTAAAAAGLGFNPVLGICGKLRCVLVLVRAFTLELDFEYLISLVLKFHYSATLNLILRSKELSCRFPYVE